MTKEMQFTKYFDHQGVLNDFGKIFCIRHEEYKLSTKIFEYLNPI